jgi:hypothetical protein
LVAFDFATGANGLGGVEIKPAGKDREPAEQHLLGFGEQRM